MQAQTACLVLFLPRHATSTVVQPEDALSRLSLRPAALALTAHCCTAALWRRSIADINAFGPRNYAAEVSLGAKAVHNKTKHKDLGDDFEMDQSLRYLIVVPYLLILQYQLNYSLPQLPACLSGLKQNTCVQHRLSQRQDHDGTRYMAA